LLLAPEYSLEIQARLPAALAAIHNFIMHHTPHDEPISSSNSNGTNDDDENENIFMGEQEDVDERRNAIAEKMWQDYLMMRAKRGIDTGNDDDLTASELEDIED
jgi:hypothetical protein